MTTLREKTWEIIRAWAFEDYVYEEAVNAAIDAERAEAVREHDKLISDDNEFLADEREGLIKERNTLRARVEALETWKDFKTAEMAQDAEEILALRARVEELQKESDYYYYYTDPKQGPDGGYGS